MTDAAPAKQADAVGACPRCGTFAPLASNGFRLLCSPCWAVARHRLDDQRTSLADLLRTVFLLLKEFWLPVCTLSMVAALPLAVLSWVLDVPLWVRLPYDWVVQSFTEAIIVSLVVQRTLGAQRGFDAVWKRAERRYFAALATNVAIGTATFAAMMLLCVPAAAVIAITWVATPIAILEDASPPTAIRESYARSRPHFWRFAFLALLLLVAATTPAVLLGFIVGATKGAGAQGADEFARVVRVLTTLMGGALRVLSLLCEITAWAATRPHRVPSLSPAC